MVKPTTGPPDRGSGGETSTPREWETIQRAVYIFLKSLKQKDEEVVETSHAEIFAESILDPNLKSAAKAAFLKVLDGRNLSAKPLANWAAEVSTLATEILKQLPGKAIPEVNVSNFNSRKTA